MLALAVIGTSSISNWFVDQALRSGLYQVEAVYSRVIERAKDFGEKFESHHYYDSIEEMTASDNVDVVYVASPNSLHYEQALIAIQNGKHVIIEKPICQSLEELTHLYAEAEKFGVVIFEAARHIYEPNFQRVKDWVDEVGLDAISGAAFTYAKYSSRYDQVLEGKEPNIFSTKFAGGALNDLGIYLVYSAVAWFGKPVSSLYVPQNIRTGVDGAGIAILNYDHFTVQLHAGKFYNSYANSEIYAGKETLVLDSVNGIGWGQLVGAAGDAEEFEMDEPNPDPLGDEIRAFASFLTNLENTETKSKLKAVKQLTLDVMTVMDQLRQS